MFMNYVGMKYGWLNIVPGIFGLGNFVRLSILSRYHFVREAKLAGYNFFPFTPLCLIRLGQVK